MSYFIALVLAVSGALFSPVEAASPAPAPRCTTLVGDWNAWPGTRGRYSPHWIARKSGARIYSPGRTSQWGAIDFAISDCRARASRGPYAGSDHRYHEYRVGGLTVGSWNVHRDRLHQKRWILRFLSRRDADVIALQEIGQYHFLLKRVRGYRFVAPTKLNGFLVRDGLRFKAWGRRTGIRDGSITPRNVPTETAFLRTRGHKIGSVHEMVGVHWRGYWPRGPRPRVRDRISSARSLVYLTR